LQFPNSVGESNNRFASYTIPSKPPIDIPLPWPVQEKSGQFASILQASAIERNIPLLDEPPRLQVIVTDPMITTLAMQLQVWLE